MSEEQQQAPAKPAKRKRDRRKLISLPSSYLPDFLRKMNRNFVLGRTLNDRFDRLVGERGGEKALDTVALDRVRSYVFANAALENSEQRLSNGELVDLAVHVQLIHASELLRSKLPPIVTKQARTFGEAVGWNTGKAA
jgi:hypothetical protein